MSAVGIREDSQIIEENFRTFFSRICAARTIHPAVSSYKTGIPFPLFNAVFQEEEVHDVHFLSVFEEATREFSQEGLPFSWWLFPKTPLDSQQKLLEKQGLAFAGLYRGCTYNLREGIPKQFPRRAEVKIQRVLNQESFVVFAQILTQTFGFERPIVDAYLELLNDFSEDCSYHHYLAFVEGKACACLTLYFHEGSVGLWNGGVVESARSLGVPAALMEFSLAYAKKRDCDFAVTILMAAAQAFSLCRKFDFKETCFFYPFLKGMDPDELES